MKKLVSALFAFVMVASLTSAALVNTNPTLTSSVPSEETQDACYEDGLVVVGNSGESDVDAQYAVFGKFYDWCVAQDHTH